MEISIDLDELVDEVRQGLDLDDLAERVKEALSDEIETIVDAAFDYKQERFKLSWMRMAESELEDLACSTKDGACGHGQLAYRAIFHAIKQFLGHSTMDEIKEYVGVLRCAEVEEEEEYEEEPEEEEDLTVITVVSPAGQVVSTSGTTWEVLRDAVNPV